MNDWTFVALYQTWAQYVRGFGMPVEQIQWMIDHIGPKNCDWAIPNNVDWWQTGIMFKHEEDAVAFKLRFGL